MDLKQKIIDSFNSGARTYDGAADIQQLTAKRLACDVAQLKTKNILEIGCGTGLFSQYLQRLFPEAHLLLTDIAPAMTAVCQGRLSRFDNVDVMCIDGEALTLPRKFDLIASNMTFHWFCHFKKSISKLLSKLTPQGHFIFSLLGENSLPEWKEICASLGVTTLTPIFPALSEIKESFPEFELRTQKISLKYDSAHAFLRTLKLLGATTPGKKHQQLSTRQLREIMTSFDKKPPSKRKITYEIIYGRYMKND